MATLPPRLNPFLEVALLGQGVSISPGIGVAVAAAALLIVSVAAFRQLLQRYSAYKASAVIKYAGDILEEVTLFRQFRYTLYGPPTIQAAYNNAAGRSFAVTTPTNSHVLVSSSVHIQELIDAPPSHLSLHAAAKELLQPKYTMRGFEWQDQRGVEGTGFVRALRSLLTAKLPILLPPLATIIERELWSQYELHKRVDGASYIPVFPSVKRLIARANALVFFGEELSTNPNFVTAALQFTQDIVIAAECVRMTPSILASCVASMVTGRHRAAKCFVNTLAPIVQARLQHRHDDEWTRPDCMQWIIDTSPRTNPWTTERMLSEIMAIWFSSIHQLAMTTTFAIEDLCSHPEYVAPLREEIERQPLATESLPRLESFLKESARYSCIDAVTCRRKALSTYTFTDGVSVAAGDWVCIPQQAILFDPRFYQDPMTFDGFRFLPENKDQSSRFTEPSLRWPIWGLGKTACPGRFYASAVAKLVLVEVLQKHDCSLHDSKRPRSRTWRSSTVPLSSTIVVFRARKT